MKRIYSHSLQPSLRTFEMTSIGVERTGGMADMMAKPSLLRLENLDTDILPPEEALSVTAKAVYEDSANSYLPFFGHNKLREAATSLVSNLSNLPTETYNWRTQCFITAGGLNGILNVLLACINPGDEVVITSPIYVGLINRIRLAGGVPKFINLVPEKNGWRLDKSSITKAISSKTRAFLMMSPSMPTGAVLNAEEWEEIRQACLATNSWMIYDAAMERLLFDQVAHIHPAGLPEMADRTITIGALSKEYRMIGWRVGWVVCPLSLAEIMGRVSVANVVCPVGIAQQAGVAAITAEDDGIVAATREWQARRDFLLKELSDFDVIKPEGGWSFLIDMSPLGLTGKEAANLLIEKADIVATSMENWGLPETERYLRIVFSNEPLSRLQNIGERVRAALKG